MKNFKFNLLGQFLALVSGLLLFAGCQEETVSPDNAAIEERYSSSIMYSYPSAIVYGLGSLNELYLYRSGPPATLISTYKIDGLQDGESLLAIDFRPATGILYGVTNMNAIYTIRVGNGYALASRVTQDAFSPAIEGSSVGFDFNPSTDKITLITSAGQNLNIDPNTGEVISIDAPIKLPMVGSAYWNTTFYNIDANEGKLYRVDPATGSFALVGPTGLIIRRDGGFDVGRSGQALAVFYSGMYGGTRPTVPQDYTREAYRLYNIDLRTGKATSFGEVNPIIGIAIQ